MTKREEVIVRLAPLPRGYKLIKDNQSTDNPGGSTLILPDGTVEYWRVAKR